MRHKIIVFLLTIVTAFTAVAAQQGVFMEYHRKSKSGNTQVPRSPMRLPIDIVYDSDTNYLSVVADDSLEAEVFVYDDNNTVIYHSLTLNCDFYLGTGVYTILIDGNEWYAEGMLEIE